MRYHELHLRYGERIAKRVEAELDAVEFKDTQLENLVDMLDERSEIARRKYQQKLIDPSGRSSADERHVIDLLHACWRNAEEISYLVSLADGINGDPLSRIAIG